MRLITLLGASALGLAACGDASADCIDIEALPAVLSEPGQYCLDRNLSTAITSGNAITVDSDDVAVDCGGFTLSGVAAGVGTAATGIRAIDRSRVQVRNCNIRGFFVGIDVRVDTGRPTGALVENNRLDGNSWRGIFVGGEGGMVRGNVVADTGGTTQPSPYTIVTAITGSRGTDVLDNTVDGVVPRAVGGQTQGIAMTYTRGTSAIGNRIRGVASGLGIIAVGTEGYVLFRDNVASAVAPTQPAYLCGASTVVLGNQAPGHSAGAYSGCLLGDAP